MALTTKKKPDPDRIVVCTMDFGTTNRTVKRGERFRASDPLVGDGRWFVDADLPESEWPNMWDEMPAPPLHAAPITVAPSIPPHRQVRSKLDVWQPMQWAPGSPGSKTGVPPPFGSAIRKGQILDVGDPRVLANPSGPQFGRFSATQRTGSACRMIPGGTHKRCTRCQGWLPFEAFPANARLKSGLSSWCRRCHLERMRAWRAEHPELIAEMNAARRSEYAADHPRTSRPCVVCGKLHSRKPGALVCSERCRTRRRRELRRLRKAS